MTTCILCSRDYDGEACPHHTRTKSRDLTTRLGESVVWIDLRVKLVTLLQRQADEGDPRARDQLAFLSTRWPGGAGPRAHEVAHLRSMAQGLLSCGRALASGELEGEYFNVMKQLEALEENLRDA